MTDGHAGPLLSPELWHRAAPILPTHDVALSGGFLGALGFRLTTVEGDRLVAERGGVELRYARTPGVDPFGAVGAAYLHVTNAELLYAELVGADVMPALVEEGPGDPAELHARWSSERDLSRLGVLRETDWGTVEFDLYDPTNNVLRCGHPA